MFNVYGKPIEKKAHDFNYLGKIKAAWSVRTNTETLDIFKPQALG